MIRKNEIGITLIALVITIIVLLILAGVSISLVVGDNGIIKKSQSAKIKTEVAEEKEILASALVQVKASDPFKNINEDEFNSALEQNSMENNKASIEGADEDTFFVKFAKSGRYYQVDKNGNGNIDYIENVDGSIKTLTIQCKNSKNQVLAEKQYKILGNKYSKELPKVLEVTDPSTEETLRYVPSISKVEGNISDGDVTINALYYLLLQDDTTLVFSGLNLNGNVTTNENDIVSYMVGTGANVNGNGLKDSYKGIDSFLYLPDEYRGKAVSGIGVRAFMNCNNIKEVIISDSISKIGTQAFDTASGIQSLTVGKNVTDLGYRSFINCSNLKTVTFKNRTISSYNQVFLGCNSLTEAKLDSNNEDLYMVADDMIYSKDGTRLLFSPRAKSGDITLLNTTESVESAVFYSNPYINSVVFPDSLLELKNNCFDGASLKSVTISENVNSIGSMAFYNCNQLTTVIINSSVVASSLTAQNAMGYLINYANTIYIRNDLTNIGSYVTSNYTETTSDKTGYNKYVKNS